MVYRSGKNSARTENLFHVEHAADFATFWGLYPRKQGKVRAWAAWEKVQPPLAACVAALAWQVNQPGWRKDGGIYVPLPATWINGRQWEDEPFHVAPAPIAKSLPPIFETEGETYVQYRQRIRDEQERAAKGEPC
jgi:hypothetical protein